MNNNNLQIRYIWFVGICFSSLLFLFSGGHVDGVEPALVWTKVHLLHSFEFPYFSPAICNGFLLGADPNNTIFTVTQLLFFFFDNPLDAWRLSAFLVSIFCAVGSARLFRAMGVREKSAQAVGGWVVTLSGWWVTHIQIGHLATFGIAFLVWLMVEAIDLAALEVVHANQTSLFWWRKSITFAALFFLLINSGHFWILPGLFLLTPICGVSGWIIFRKYGLGTLWFVISTIIFGAGMALAMSAVRFAAIFTFAVPAFPRSVEIFQVIGDTKVLTFTILRSFFDFTVITRSEHSGMLGSHWEWAAYMGLVSLPLSLIGIFAVKPRNKWFYVLLVASFLQFILTRTTHFGELIRALVPALREITWFYRGIVVQVITASFFVALGIESLTRMTRLPIAAIIFTIIIVDFSIVYPWPTIEKPTDYFSRFDWRDEFRSGRIIRGQAAANYCYNPILGYTSSSHHSQVTSGGINEVKKQGFYNINDVRALFSPKGRTGIYKTEPWPLWPVADREALYKFLSYKQVNELPTYFIWIRMVSAVGWVGFVLAIVAAARAHLQNGQWRKIKPVN